MDRRLGAHVVSQRTDVGDRLLVSVNAEVTVHGLISAGKSSAARRAVGNARDRIGLGLALIRQMVSAEIGDLARDLGRQNGVEAHTVTDEQDSALGLLELKGLGCDLGGQTGNVHVLIFAVKGQILNNDRKAARDELIVTEADDLVARLGKRILTDRECLFGLRLGAVGGADQYLVLGGRGGIARSLQGISRVFRKEIVKYLGSKDNVGVLLRRNNEGIIAQIHAVDRNGSDGIIGKAVIRFVRIKLIARVARRLNRVGEVFHSLNGLL